MIEQFKSYFKKLEGLSRDELVHSAGKLVVAENGNIAKLIAHLAEMSARKAALELGYKSLYDYCIRALNLSEGAVPARIHVANVSRRFPQLLVALAECRVSLTVAALLAPHLTDDNVDDVISDCAGKTRKETEEYVLAFRPKPVFEPSIRKRSESAKKVTQVEPSSSPPSSSPTTPPAEKPKSSPTILQPAQPEIFNFRFSADRDFKDKFERLAEVLGVDKAQAHMADIRRRRSTSRSTRRTRRRSSSGGERGRRRAPRHLVRTRCLKKTRQRSLGTFTPRFLSGFTNGAVTNVSIRAMEGRGVLRGPDCTSTTGRRSPSIAETMSDCFNFYARNTICCRRSVSTGRILSSGRLLVEDEKRHG